MTTFSQLVDKMVLELKRPDMVAEIATYLNQTIRELHMEPGKGNAIYFADNLHEAQVTPNIESGWVWSIPKVSTFQTMKAIRYDSLWAGTFGTGPQDRSWGRSQEPVWADIIPPGRGMNRREYYAYRAGGGFAFHGYGGSGATISLSWYEYPSVLKYYSSGLGGTGRPASYDEELGWTYATVNMVDYGSTAILQAQAQALCSNWLLLRWPMVIEEGLRAKVYKRVSDTERARTSFSMYMTLRQGLYTAEIGDIGGSWS